MRCTPGANPGIAAAGATGLQQTVEHTFPTSIIDAMARGEVLQIVVFSFLFGTACAAIPAKSRAVVDFCQALSDVMFRYTNYVMLFAPLGVFGAMAATIGDKGLGVLLNLGKLVLTLYATQMFFIVVVLGTVTAIARIPVRRFIRWVREPFLIAFSTASSEAALPLALENMQSFGVPKHIAAFVLPTGYSFNLDGSTLYLSLASMFVAQAAGIHLSLGTQITMMLTLMLTSKGVAAVPRASLVILAGTLATFNLPVEGVALLLGVDALMDMARTSVNLLGNCLATAVVARWEGIEFPATDAEPARLRLQQFEVDLDRHGDVHRLAVFGSWLEQPLAHRSNGIRIQPGIERLGHLNIIRAPLGVHDKREHDASLDLGFLRFRCVSSVPPCTSRTER